jgi:AcrR family transcriptional regulator
LYKKTGELPVNQTKSDRRSLRTQQALMDALIVLLAEKQYDEISINDIVSRANVGRSTFYMHYQAKDDLLKSGFERVLDTLMTHIVLSQADRNLQLDTTLFFRHAQGHYELYRTLVWGSGFDILTRDGHAALAVKFQDQFALLLAGKPQPSIPLDILSYSMAGTLLILLKWWLDHKMPYSPERMNEICQQLVLSNAGNILGLSPVVGK